MVEDSNRVIVKQRGCYGILAAKRYIKKQRIYMYHGPITGQQHEDILTGSTLNILKKVDLENSKYLKNKKFSTTA